MPNWKKVIVSGSDATLNSLFVASSVTASTISASSGITGSLFGTASWSNNAQTASYSQALRIQSTLTSYTSSTTTTGVNTLFTQATSSYNSAFGKYTVLSGSNARAGEVMTVWTSGSIAFTDFATTDIGSTTSVTFSSSFSGGNILLQTSASAGWTVKMLATFI